MRLLILAVFSVLNIPLAFSGFKCNVNVKTVPMDFVAADRSSKEWYTPYSSHFINQTNFCSTSYYKLDFPFMRKGLEINASIKKGDIKKSPGLDYSPGKKPWVEMSNYFVEDAKIPGVSHWTTKIGPFTIKTDQHVFAVSPNYHWWATYYCAPGIKNLKMPFTEGIDIRSTSIPLDPRVVEEIKRRAIDAGIDPKLVQQIKPSGYAGCRVKAWDGKKFIVAPNSQGQK
jgi:hypothetical protein